MRAADHLIDMVSRGGRSTGAGSSPRARLAEVAKVPESPTGQFLSGARVIPVAGQNAANRRAT